MGKNEKLASGQTEEEKNLKREVEGLGKKREKAMEEFRGERKEFSEESEKFLKKKTKELAKLLNCNDRGSYTSEQVLMYDYPEIQEVLSARPDLVLDLIKVALIFEDSRADNNYRGGAELFFDNEFSFIKGDFKNDRVRPELIKLIKYQHDTELFKFDSPLYPLALVNILRKGGFEAVKESLGGVKKMIKSAGNYYWLLIQYAFVVIGEKFFLGGYEAIEDDWDDLIDMADDMGPYSLLVFDHIFLSFAEEFRRGGYEAIRENWRDLREMIDDAGEDAPLLIEYGLSPVIEEFKSGGYEAVRGYWQDLIKFVKYGEMKESSMPYLWWEFLEEEFKDDRLRPTLLEIAEFAGKDTGILLSICHSNADEEFKDDKLRPDLIKLLKFSLSKDGKIFRGFPMIREEFRDDKLRPDLLEMAKLGGETAPNMFRFGFSPIREQFREGGLESIKEYWLDLAKLFDLNGYKEFFSVAPTFHRMEEEFKNPKL
ncbi:hypothetical protein KJ632_03680, partial [Patescibacteria group bacterium]|nr:hypothetical protein [Patescibacteria group bacterium]